MTNKWLRVIHWIIILNFLAEIIYGSYMTFFVVGGAHWPLFARAVDSPVEVILKRRLYAVETWLATVGLSLYLAITLFLPRFLSQWLDKMQADSTRAP